MAAEMIGKPVFWHDKHADSLRPRQNGRQLSWRHIQMHFVECNIQIMNKISPKFVPKGLINHIPALVVAWSAPSDYLNQWWIVYWRIYASLGLNELKWQPVSGQIARGWFWVQNGQKSNGLIQGKCFIWTMTSNYLTQNEEHDIPSQILETILDCMPQLCFRPQYAWILSRLYAGMIPNSHGQLAGLIVFIIPVE